MGFGFLVIDVAVVRVAALPKGGVDLPKGMRVAQRLFFWRFPLFEILFIVKLLRRPGFLKIARKKREGTGPFAQKNPCAETCH